MEDSFSRELLVEGVASAKAHEADVARRYLERLLRLDPPIEDCIEAWFWLSQISTDSKEKRDFLELILANNPAEMRARRALEIVDGKLKAADIVDPDRLVPAAPLGAKSTAVDRFICPRCGGKMTFAADGQSLTCDYCEAHRQMTGRSGGSTGTVKEKDFLAAMATSKGHLAPVQMRSFCCQGCGVSFILPPAQMSLTCPYCGSAYVVAQTETRELIAPDGVLPFKVDKNQANQILFDWFQKHVAVDPNQVFQAYGIYLPVWLFDITGAIPWRCLKYVNRVWVPETGEQLVIERNRIVSASKHDLPGMKALLASYALDDLAPYDPGYLADWPAETYQVSVAEAALDARKASLDIERDKINNSFLNSIRDLYLNTAQMVIESYKLALLPVWINRLKWEDKSYEVLVNGQNGQVFGEHPTQGLLDWLKQLL